MSESNSLVTLLVQSKQEMIRLSGHSANVDGEWDRAQSLLQWARQLDGMIQGLNGVSGPQKNSTDSGLPLKPAPSVKPSKLPYYYIDEDDNKLAKIGTGREGGTYQHRVTRKNYDVIVQRLIAISRAGKTFETADLVDHCDVPRHEPLIVLGVLEERGLVINIRRGRWTFENLLTFSTEIIRIWTGLPRQ